MQREWWHQIHFLRFYTRRRVRIILLFSCGTAAGRLSGVKCALERVRLWWDGQDRPGPDNMAVDEWMLETAREPVIRVYGWQGNWGSLGYFMALDEARASFPGESLSWVRRWTGGGVVNHTDDWTYTLVVPSGHALAGLRGAESYRLVHEALAAVLAREGACVRLSTGAESTGVAACFQNPVGYDVVDAGAGKVAGAGQRRTRFGLLHQGSVAGKPDATGSGARAAALAQALARDVVRVECEPPPAWIAERVASRYGREDWLRAR